MLALGGPGLGGRCWRAGRAWVGGAGGRAGPGWEMLAGGQASPGCFSRSGSIAIPPNYVHSALQFFLQGWGARMAFSQADIDYFRVKIANGIINLRID